jgi:hypothetical protein
MFGGRSLHIFQSHATLASLELQRLAVAHVYDLIQLLLTANRSEGERISISFNIMFSAFTENLSKPLWGDEAASS